MSSPAISWAVRRCCMWGGVFDVARRAMQEARSKGAQVVWPGGTASWIGMENLAELMRLADFVLMSRSERGTTGCDEPEVAARLLLERAPSVVATLGEQERPATAGGHGRSPMLVWAQGQGSTHTQTPTSRPCGRLRSTWMLWTPPAPETHLRPASYRLW